MNLLSLSKHRLCFSEEKQMEIARPQATGPILKPEIVIVKNFKVEMLGFVPVEVI